MKCPQKVFTLPLTATFTLNDVEYKGSVLNIVYQQKEDPLFIEKLNYHLNPQIKWHNLTAEFDDEWRQNELKIKQDLKALPVFQFSDKTHWTVWEIILISVGAIIGTWIMLTTIKLVRNKSRHMPWRNIKEPEAMKDESIPLQEMKSTSVQGTRHEIIIQT